LAIEPPQSKHIRYPKPHRPEHDQGGGNAACAVLISMVAPASSTAKTESLIQIFFAVESFMIVLLVEIGPLVRL